MTTPTTSPLKRGDQILMCFNGAKKPRVEAKLGTMPRTVLRITLRGNPVVRYLFRCQEVRSWVEVGHE